MEKLKQEEQTKADKLKEVSYLKDEVSKTSLRQNIMLRYQHAKSKLQVDNFYLEFIS